ncbi:hypothetical protein [Luteimonas sp. A501]
MKSIAALLLALLLAGCSAAPDGAVAVLFEHRDFRVGRYCLDVRGGDPGPELLANILKYNPNVLPASQCHHADPGYKTSDGTDIRMLRIVKIRRESPSIVTLDVVHDSGFLLGSSGTTYTVEKLSGFWIVTDSTVEWLS